MPKDTDNNMTTLSTKVPDEWAVVIDEKAKSLGASTGALYNRTDIVRMALARFLGLIEKQAGDTQPTT
jgi:hypothetical protein